jgi:hypothetical protein
MSDRRHDIGPPVIMTDEVDRFYHRLSARIGDLVDAEIKLSGLDQGAGSAAAMACLRVVAYGLWRSLPPSQRTDAGIREALRRCADVATDNLMAELGRGRRQ